MVFKIYTKTGDSGRTGLYGGSRVAKDDARIEAYGTVDELNAMMGVCRTQLDRETGYGKEFDRLLTEIQHDLFALGAELATLDPDKNSTRWDVEPRIALLERAIDSAEAQLAPLQQFILPAGTAAAAQLHLARTVCRRAERRLVTLANQSRDPLEAAAAMALPVEADSDSDNSNAGSNTVQCSIGDTSIVLEPVGGEIVSSGLIVYLNRLGDLLFVLARAANAAAGVADEPWRKH